MKKYRFLWLLCSLFVLCACGDKEKEYILTVASERYMLSDGYPCFIVKFDKSEKWTIIGKMITGFDYEPGHEYVLKVKEKIVKNPPVDYQGAYTVLELISKEKKNSENLPPKPDWAL